MIAEREPTDYNEFEAELLKNPQVRKEYEALKPKYDRVKQKLEDLTEVVE